MLLVKLERMLAELEDASEFAIGCWSISITHLSEWPVLVYRLGPFFKVLFNSLRSAQRLFTGGERSIAPANKGHDTRALQAYLGHKNIQHTVRYTELSPDRFKDFWR